MQQQQKFKSRLKWLALSLSSVLALPGQSTLAASAANTAPPGAPNVVVVLLDDVGFGASSVFGGASQTPELQRLADQGLRYNRFHVTGISSPTRAALLTGRNAHRAGFGTVAEIASGFPGYDMRLKPENAVVAQVLHENGYTTAAFGKWHNTPFNEQSAVGPFDRWPTGVGFDYFYGFLNGEANQWEPVLYRNTTQVPAPKSAEQGYHFTENIADEAIHWVHQSKTLAPDKPFFVYFAPGGTHAPLHVPEAWIGKYKGQFDQGWDKLREETFARQKQLGVIPQNAVLTPRPKEFPAWDSLKPEQKKLLSRQMEVYAAFLEHTDHEVGRVVREAQKYGGDNTLVIYLVGDNGASGEGGENGTDASYASFIGGDNTVEHQIAHQNELGSVAWDNHYATPWAWATNTPFQWVKQMPSHLGASRDPLVISWPARIKNKGGLRSQFSHVTDIVPTIYEAAGITPPTSLNGVTQNSFDGNSLIYSFDQANAPSPHTTQYFEVHGNLGIYKDGWYASSANYFPWLRVQPRPANGPKWELYNLDEDFSQSKDLAAENPAKLKELQAVFDAEAKRNFVYPLVPNGKNGVVASTAKSKHLVLPGDVSGIPAAVLPDLGRSHRLSLQLEVPKTPANGVLVADGGRYGGFSLYAKDGQLFYELNVFGQYKAVLKSQQGLSAGKAEIQVEFKADPVKPAGETTLLSLPAPVSGTVTLSLNGKVVAQQKVERFGGFASSIYEPLDIGRDNFSRVSSAYGRDNTFNGHIENLTIDVE